MRTAPVDAASLEACISAVGAAPSIYNSQPWCFRLDPDNVALEVRAVLERGLRHADPVGRALHVSVGAAVFNLRVAMAHFGWGAVVRLLPDPEDPSVLATLRLSGTSQRQTAGYRPDLYPMIWRRHSSRFPFSGRPLPANVRAELAEAAQTEGAVLTFSGSAETARLLRVATEAEHRNRADPDRTVESRRWVHRGPDHSGEVGMPQTALGPRDAHQQLPLRDFTAQRHPERLPAQPFRGPSCGSPADHRARPA